MKHRLAQVVLPAVVVAALAAGCETPSSLHGTVTRCDTGDPIVGVIVQLYYGEPSVGDHADEIYTSPDGAFDFGDVGSGDKSLTLRFIKPGYRFENLLLTDATDSPIDQCLTPGDFTPIGDAGVDASSNAHEDGGEDGGEDH